MNRSIWTLRFQWWPWFGLVWPLGRDIGDNNLEQSRRPPGVKSLPGVFAVVLGTRYHLRYCKHVARSILTLRFR